MKEKDTSENAGKRLAETAGNAEYNRRKGIVESVGGILRKARGKKMKGKKAWQS